MTKEKKDKIRLKNARPYNWYLDFKKREEEAKKGNNDSRPIDASVDR